MKTLLVTALSICCAIAFPAILPAQEKPAEPAVKVVATHGAWQLREATTFSGEMARAIYQLGLDEKKNPVAEIHLQVIQDGERSIAGFTAVAPLGTLLTPGLILRIDDGEEKRFPFTHALQAGTFTNGTFTPDQLSELKSGKTLTLTITSMVKPDQPVSVNFSLEGFTAAWETLSK